jgi:hypothetical protein
MAVFMRLWDAYGQGSWRSVLGDRSYLLFSAVHVAFVLRELALTIAMPLYAVSTLGLDLRVPGVAVSINCAIVALLQTPTVAVITGRRRAGVLQLSSGLCAVAAVAMFAASEVSSTPATAIVSVVLFTMSELLESPVISSVSVEAARVELRGRYLAVFQRSWTIPLTVAPAVLTALVSAGPAPLWLTVLASCCLGAAGTPILYRRMPVLRQEVRHARS